MQDLKVGDLYLTRDLLVAELVGTWGNSFLCIVHHHTSKYWDNKLNTSKVLVNALGKCLDAGSGYDLCYGAFKRRETALRTRRVILKRRY